MTRRLMPAFLVTALLLGGLSGCTVTNVNPKVPSFLKGFVTTKPAYNADLSTGNIHLLQLHQFPYKPELTKKHNLARFFWEPYRHWYDQQLNTFEDCTGYLPSSMTEEIAFFRLIRDQQVCDGNAWLPGNPETQYTHVVEAFALADVKELPGWDYRVMSEDGLTMIIPGSAMFLHRIRQSYANTTYFADGQRFVLGVPDLGMKADTVYAIASGSTRSEYASDIYMRAYADRVSKLSIRNGAPVVWIQGEEFYFFNRWFFPASRELVKRDTLAHRPEH
ncbi:hypothetical protein [Ferrimonas kyonanensis]|uniref:hypothetical protein n=1 Tax=Ferrimonas kyonanensis TaxID=364763 RepID=UPI0004864349|nr:hypothetical protein [Ferrimonas kyonanensis]